LEGAIASQYPPTYDDITLHILEQASRDVWEVLKAHDAYHDSEEDRDLQTGIALTLMALADRGVTDPQELLSGALDCFDLEEPH
jgi:hypothetical protein